MRILYRLLSGVIYFILWPYGRIRASMGSELWRGRLALIKKLEAIDVWIHAASVGETKIAGYLIEYLRHKEPGIRIYLSTMTTAGQKIAKVFKSDSVTAGYFPIDSIGPAKRTLMRINPRLLVIAETEIWPNLIEQASERGIPIILINGRMSDKAFKKYKLIKQMLKRLLLMYDRVFVKSSSDREKLKYFDLSDNKISVAGDMKFDAPMSLRSNESIKNTRRAIGASESDFVLVAGSTRPGEEALLINLFKAMSGAQRPFRLVVAPRHLSRIDEVKSEISMQNLGFGVYGSDNGTSPVTLVDKMGQLNDLYQAADLAFVGGTLVNVGGHNILEPVWAGTPVLFGPYVGNIIEAKDYVLDNNYGAMVNTAEEMVELVTRFMNNKSMFAIKSQEDLLHSPTAMAGAYILERLAHV